MHQEQKENRLQCTKSRKNMDFNASRAERIWTSMHQEQKEYGLQCTKSKKKIDFNALRAKKRETSMHQEQTEDRFQCTKRRKNNDEGKFFIKMHVGIYTFLKNNAPFLENHFP